MKTVRLRILGRVQGVGYRAWAIRIAAELGVRGWVRNRADGAVEILGTGSDEAIDALIAAARHGPSAARVEEIRVSHGEDDGSLGFTALPSL
jgi:acylphosphatase